MQDAESRRELLELYKLAHSEYRAEVALGSERQKLFLGLNPISAALVANLAQHAPLAGRIGLIGTAAISAAGILVIWRSHGRYRAVRNRMVAMERELGIKGFDTTGGMRVENGEPRRETFKISTVVMAALALLTVLELSAAAFF